MIPKRLPLALFLVVATGLACSESTETIVVLRAHLAAGATSEPLLRLGVEVEHTGRFATRDYGRPDGKPLKFPTTLAIELGPEVAGSIGIDARGIGASDTVLVAGTIESLSIRPGRAHNADLWLDCFGPDCRRAGGGPSDARALDAMTAVPSRDADATCGNGRLDPGETCDLAIMRGLHGACPSTCDDGIACTVDTRIGSGCTTRCRYQEIKHPMPDDRCCPPHATRSTDRDCSPTCGNGTIEPGETCDLGITAGNPGACPGGSDCLDQDACTLGFLVSENTCAARCVYLATAGFLPADGCCPAGATHTTDPDCPAVCGNGVVEPGETCDPDVPTYAPGACPFACKASAACAVAMLEGAGCNAICRSTAVTQPIAGDGCCPVGANRNLDPDCLAVCGNGAVEPGENCDKGIASGKPGSCPTSCVPSSGCLQQVLEGAGANCSARCVTKQVAVCSSGSDDCCPPGCTSANDPDCSLTCGNRSVEPGERCDTAIPIAMAGACPKWCDAPGTCMSATLFAPGTCHARCQTTTISLLVSGDGCCPQGGNHNNDADCPPLCGNGVIEGPRETCDKAIPAGALGSCPAVCPAVAACKRSRLLGDPAACTARCESETVTACQNNDGCCPAGCNRKNDDDCQAVCGNGILEPGETCDKRLTAGIVGSCPATCDERGSCAPGWMSGSVDDCTSVCSYAPITACVPGDRCCPAGCTAAADADCAASCGNGVVESGESCDPPTSCPTSCPDDGDPCTMEKLQGTPTTCSATCMRVPVSSCSGKIADLCCPTGCAPLTDLDCTAAAP